MNVRALTTDEKLEELAEELNAMRWDAITLNETRRSESEEIMQLDSKHRFFDSGGGGGKHGVALLHTKDGLEA